MREEDACMADSAVAMTNNNGLKKICKNEFSDEWNVEMEDIPRTIRVYLNGHVGEWLPLQPQWQHCGELQLTNACASPVVVREDIGVEVRVVVVVVVLDGCIAEERLLGSHGEETGWLLTVFDGRWPAHNAAWFTPKTQEFVESVDGPMFPFRRYEWTHFWPLKRNLNHNPRTEGWDLPQIRFGGISNQESSWSLGFGVAVQEVKTLSQHVAHTDSGTKI